MASPPFFSRLRAYYQAVAAVLRGEAGAAAVFPNGSDVGSSRERIFADFLRQHAPSKCNVCYGGFLFGADGSESGQVDVVVMTDTAPQFNLHNPSGEGKAFFPVDGCLALASIKSTLDRRELFNSLDSIARVPPHSPSVSKVSPYIKGVDLDDWPYKIVYASNGISPDAAIQHLEAYYWENPDVPLGRRPHLIYVSGQYAIFRIVVGQKVWDRASGAEEERPVGSFFLLTTEADLQAIVWMLHHLQMNANAAERILFSYGEIINRVVDIPQ